MDAVGLPPEVGVVLSDLGDKMREAMTYDEDERLGITHLMTLL